VHNGVVVVLIVGQYVEIVNASSYEETTLLPWSGEGGKGQFRVWLVEFGW
jgi:hypothetical protein